jgi:hypothetical protein
MKFLTLTIVTVILLATYQNCSQVEALSSSITHDIGRTKQNAAGTGSSDDLSTGTTNAPSESIEAVSGGDYFSDLPGVFEHEDYSLAQNAEGNLKIRINIQNYSVAQLQALQLCFRNTGVTNCKSLSQWGLNAANGIQELVGFPVDFIPTEGRTTVYFNNAVSGTVPMATANFESVKESWYVAGNIRDKINYRLDDQLSLVIYVKNQGNQFSACAEKQGSGACVPNAYWNKATLLAAPAPHGFVCLLDENDPFGFCTRFVSIENEGEEDEQIIYPTLRQLGFVVEENRPSTTYTIHVRNDSTRFPNLIKSFTITVTR